MKTAFAAVVSFAMIFAFSHPVSARISSFDFDDIFDDDLFEDDLFEDFGHSVFSPFSSFGFNHFGVPSTAFLGFNTLGFNTLGFNTIGFNAFPATFNTFGFNNSAFNNSGFGLPFSDLNNGLSSNLNNNQSTVNFPLTNETNGDASGQANMAVGANSDGTFNLTAKVTAKNLPEEEYCKFTGWLTDEATGETVNMGELTKSAFSDYKLDFTKTIPAFPTYSMLSVTKDNASTSSSTLILKGHVPFVTSSN